MKTNFLILFTLLSLSSFAQNKKKADDKNKDWKVADLHGPAKDVSFETDEGTWMNVDVSPDGKQIVFDLLGDIYIMPLNGGEAKILCEGTPFEVQPRFSPDGKMISYTSDRDGGDNIWVMNVDGTNPHAISKESFRLCNNAVWMPDGLSLVAKKHFTAGRSLGSGEMWQYHISGGSGLELTKKKNEQQDVGEPCVSHDGRYVFWSEDMTEGPYFKYNKDPNPGIYVIRRLDTKTGKIEDIIGGAGGACRPQISPDDKLMAFVKRVRLQSVLYIHDLTTGEEWPIYTDLSRDQQETWATFGVYTGFNWTPDGKNIIIWAKGKIRKIDVQKKTAEVIPFKVKVHQIITEAVKFPQEVAPKTFEAKMLRDVVTSPNGNAIVFNAAGHIYLKKLPNGTPERLTKNEFLEYFPSFSADGKNVVYVGWNDSDLAAIYTTAAMVGGTPTIKKITTEKGFYYSPSFSKDGSKILFYKGGGDGILGNAFSLNQGIYWMDAKGGKMNFITDEGSNPQWSADGKSVYYSAGKTLKTIDLESKEIHALYSSQYGKDFTVSPNGKYIAWTELFNAYIAPFNTTGSVIDLSAGTTSFPNYKLTRDAGTCLHWSGDSKKLNWVLGGEYFSREIKNCFTYTSGLKDSIPPRDTIGIKVNLVLNTDIPNTNTALTGARIITMKGDEVIENGTILIHNNRIEKIGKTADIKIPDGYKTIDVKGKTITPGFVDVHAHFGNSGTGISPMQQWSYFANLAFGVTTSHDPSSNTEMVFSQSEMQKCGVMVAPRIYSTGTILYGADGDFKAVINSFEDAKSHLRRLKMVGAFSVKSYNQPRRNQQQQVIEAARELQMMVVPEGGSFLNHNLTQIMDGHTGIEHCLPVAPLYKDVLSFWSASKTQYTPTLIVAYGGMMGENYWYQKTNVWENKRLLTYYPQEVIDARSRRRPMLPDDDWNYMTVSKSVTDLQSLGVKANLGAHGQLHGLGAHWELWMLQQGGMSNLQALRCATLNGAEYIGMDKDLGSLEVGKLADLIVMDKNPLENIRNSEFISYVMLNGRLYDAATMNEVNGKFKRHKFFFEYGKTGGGMETKSNVIDGD